MSTLLRMLKEAKVPLTVFCEKLEITEEQAMEIANTADEDTQMDTYLGFVTAMNDERLFPELLDFYSPFVVDRDELAALIASVLKLRDNNIPRRMLNSVHRLVTLADAMDEVRPGKDSLKIFYYVVCIESLFHLRDGEVGNKTLALIEFFKCFITESDQQLILNRFQRSLGDERYRRGQLSHETVADYENRIHSPDWLNTQVTMEIFARIINEIRNCFAHEGDYWTFNFANSDYSMMNSLTVAENQTESRRRRTKGDGGLRRVYSVDLFYNQFQAVCVRGYLQFIKAYVQGLTP